MMKTTTVVFGALATLLTISISGQEPKPRLGNDVKPQSGAREKTGGDEAPGSADKAAADERKRFTDSDYEGSVVVYRPTLENRFGIKLAEALAADLLALATDDGKLLPILPTDSALVFYRDGRNQQRKMRLRARVYEKTPGLLLLTVRSVKDGEPHEIYYWCNVCSIKHFWDKPCECCQGPLEYREEPAEGR